MPEEPIDLTHEMLDGTERMRVTRKMREPPGIGARTGPLKVWRTSILDIIQFARKVSPTIRSIVLSTAGHLSVTNTAGQTQDLGPVAVAPMLSGNGAPTPGSGVDGQFYLDKLTGNLYQEKADKDGLGSSGQS